MAYMRGPQYTGPSMAETFQNTQAAYAQQKLVQEQLKRQARQQALDMLAQGAKAIGQFGMQKMQNTFAGEESQKSRAQDLLKFKEGMGWDKEKFSAQQKADMLDFAASRKDRAATEADAAAGRELQKGHLAVSQEELSLRKQAAAQALLEGAEEKRRLAKDDAQQAALGKVLPLVKALEGQIDLAERQGRDPQQLRNYAQALLTVGQPSVLGAKLPMPGVPEINKLPFIDPRPVTPSIPDLMAGGPKDVAARDVAESALALDEEGGVLPGRADVTEQITELQAKLRVADTDAGMQALAAKGVNTKEKLMQYKYELRRAINNLMTKRAPVPLHEKEAVPSGNGGFLRGLLDSMTFGLTK